MTASELRIGNYVSQDGEEIHGIVSLTIHRFEISQIKLEPIPLTEEWFQKFERFYKDGEYWSIDIYDYKYCFKYRDWAGNWAFYQEFTDSPFEYDEGKKYPVSFDIYYVHQIQNLYFALTGEELIIK